MKFLRELNINNFKSILIFFNIDWYRCILNWWNQINPVYKKSFFIVFIVANIIFAYNTINFMWGNHEWPYIVGNVPYDYSFYEGRITEKWEFIFFNDQFLPIFFSVFQILGITLGAIALAYFWKIPKTVFNYVLFGLFVISIPYHMINFFHPSFYDWNLFFILSAYIICEKTYNNKNYLIYQIIPILFLFQALNTYPSSINTVFVVFIGRIILEYIFENKTIKELMKKYWLLFIDIIITILLMKISLIFLKSIGRLAVSFYNIQIINIKDIFHKFIEIVPYMFIQFTQTYPFITGFYHYELNLICIIALITLLICAYKKCVKTFIYTIIGVFLLILATETAIYISSNTEHLQYLARIVRCGLMYIYVFSIAVMMIVSNNKIWLKNIILTIMIIVTWHGAMNEVYAQKVFKMAYDAEMRSWDNIVQSIINTGKLDYKKYYTLFIFGEIGMRQEYYKDKYNNADVSLLRWNYTAHWLLDHFFKVRYPQIKILSAQSAQLIRDHGFNININAKNWIMYKADVYPKRNSVYIDDNTIIVVLDKYYLETVKQRIANDEKAMENKN